MRIYSFAAMMSSKVEAVRSWLNPLNGSAKRSDHMLPMQRLTIRVSSSESLPGLVVIMMLESHVQRNGRLCAYAQPFRPHPGLARVSPRACEAKRAQPPSIIKHQADIKDRSTLYQS